MKSKNKKPIFPFLIIMATLFMGIGYATVNSVTLDISGTVTAMIPEGLFISNVVSNSGDSVLINAYEDTVVNSTVSLSSTDPNSTASYTVTVMNRSNTTYYYDDVKYLLGSTTYSNENIEVVVSGITLEQAVSPGASVTFTATFKYTENYKKTSAPYNNTLISYINYDFTDVLHTHYSITYSGLTDIAGLPTLTDANETVSINFGNRNVVISSITMGGTSISNYTFNNGLLSLPAVTGNVVITLLDTTGVEIVIDGNNTSITVPGISAENPISVDDFLNGTYDGKNYSDKRITDISVTVAFTKKGGGNQSTNLILSVNGSQKGTQILDYSKTSPITVDFIGLNISTSDTFTLTNTINKLSNRSITISGMTINVTFG